MEKKLFAVDTNVLLDRAANNETVIDALETIQKRVKNSEIIVPPTALHELAYFCSEPSGTRKKLAVTVMCNMLEWGIQPLNLVPVGHGIVEVIAKTILDKGLLPDTQRNDSLILAESSLIGASVFLSSDDDMLSVNQDKLKFYLSSHDVSAPIIVSPFKIVKKFF